MLQNFNVSSAVDTKKAASPKTVHESVNDDVYSQTERAELKMTTEQSTWHASNILWVHRCQGVNIPRQVVTTQLEYHVDVLSRQRLDVQRSPGPDIPGGCNYSTGKE